MIMQELLKNLLSMIETYFHYKIWKAYKPYTISGIKGSWRLLKMYLNKEEIG